MAGTSLFALIDDITTILDDVAVMTKVAAKKTAGVVGDDLALNAQGLTGLDPHRETPVVLAVAKGSMINKVILIPTALVISIVAPWAIIPLLMVGGAYLCFEGVEKLAHKFFHKEDHSISEAHTTKEFIRDPVNFEKDKIKGAIRTDFILSAEIMVIALGSVASSPLATQIGVLTAVGIGMTFGVYGLVAGLVKLDDLGLHWSEKKGSRAHTKTLRYLGRKLLILAPALMKTLSVVGTAAMFIVGGEILAHGIPPVEHAIHDLSNLAGGFFGGVVEVFLAAGFGMIGGIVAMPIFQGVFKAVSYLPFPKKS